MRQVVLDTETTGLEPSQGHRIIEIGCVELKNRRRTDGTFHQYINPQRDIEDGAYDVHGLSNEFLSGKPLFGDIAQDFINFIRDSELIIHNAPFDVAFINSELEQLEGKWGKVEDYCSIIDTLKLARELHPGQKNSLDALCGRYDIDNSQRDLHGALLDAQLLMEVYLAMTGGQTALSLEDNTQLGTGNLFQANSKIRKNFVLKVIEANADEQAAHEKFLNLIEKDNDIRSIWRKLEEGNPESD